MQDEFLNNLTFHAIGLVGRDDKADSAVKQIIAKLQTPPEEIWSAPSEPITIKEVRSLIGWMNQAPFSGKTKIAVVPLKGVRREAQAALLKILEEPPAYGKFILTAKTRQEIHPTIKSRIQTVLVGAPGVAPAAKTENIPLLDEFLSASDRLENEKTEDIIDSWIYELAPQIRKNRQVKTIQKLLELKSLAQSNASPSLILQCAVLAKGGLSDDI